MKRCIAIACVAGVCGLLGAGSPLSLGFEIEGDFEGIDLLEFQPAIPRAAKPLPPANVDGQPPVEKARDVPPAEVKEAVIDKDATFGPFPGGVVDREWSVAYVLAAGGTLDAVDLKTGRKLWASAGVAIPLAVEQDRVYALAPTLAADSDHPALHVVGLSIKGQGKLVFKSKPIKVEDWVAGQLGGKMLQAAAKIENGKLILSWNASATQIQGGGGGGGDAWVGGGRRMRPMPVRPGVAVNLAAKGSGKVDLKAGTIEETDKEKPLVAIAGPADVKRNGRVFKLVTNPDKAAASVTCTDVTLNKLVWKYDLELMVPGAGGAMGAGTGGGEGIVPMPPVDVFDDVIFKF